MMSDTMTEMDRIISLLREKGGMSEDEIKGTIEKIRKEKPEVKGEKPRLVLNDKAATIVFVNGFTVSFDKNGSVAWAYKGNKIVDGESQPGGMPLLPCLAREELEVCLTHLMGLHIKDRQQCHEAFKLYQATMDEQEPKMRYMTKGTKRAFVSGMILGRKEAKG